MSRGRFGPELIPLIGALALLAGCYSASTPAADADEPFNAEILLEGLDQPWALAFLPDGDLLITEKSGQLRHVADGELQPEPVSGLPVVVSPGQGGLMDVALHPEFADEPGERWVYLSYVSETEDGYGTTLGRGRWRDGAVEAWETLFTLPKTTRGGRHFGSRLVFGRDGTLYMSIGDRGERERAQDLSDPAGSILRFNADGSIPSDNPFVGRDDAHPAIYSYGHRNPQGLVRAPDSDLLWIHEHGPRGGDEVNRLVAGENYGWPVVSHGAEYASGRPVGEAKSKAGMIDPRHVWVPSIAPSGLAYYQGEPFRAWNGDLLAGALKFQLLAHLEMRGNEVHRERRYLKQRFGRIRDVRVGPDGLIYLLTDARNGRLIRLSPAR